MRRLPTTILILSMTAAVAGCSAPRMIAPKNADDYYANASVRLGETGSVVLHFSIGPNGKAREPITHDEPVIVGQGNSQDDRASLRLIASAEKYLRDAEFDARGIHKRRLTASFVFEVKPCGTLAHSSIHDYAISLCRERPPIPAMPAPHCRLINERIQC
jgi:hypothetical protein